MKRNTVACTTSDNTFVHRAGNDADHLFIAKQALAAQSEAITQLAARLGQPFNQTIATILQCTGRVVVCGMGKSGLVGKKMVATLSSTGTPSFFLHPAEAFHGDLGMLLPDDLVFLISYSGETEEVIKLIPSLRSFGNKIVAITGKGTSTLATNADIWLDISVEREICPNNLAPTTSTLATMALGDAIAVALINARDFKPADFARYHPGGSLGRKLLTRVRDVMYTDLPVVSLATSFYECLMTMNTGRKGLALVMENGNLVGIVTDGDMRRALLNNSEIHQSKVEAFMTAKPRTIDLNVQLAEAEAYMQEHKLRALVAIDGASKKVCGIVEIFN